MNRAIKNAATEQIENIMSPKVEKNWTFSKILCISILFGTLVIALYACGAMWYFGDFSALEYLITAVFAECAVVTGFYSWKAKEENKIKLDIKRQILLATLNNNSSSSTTNFDDEEEYDDPPDGYGAL